MNLSDITKINFGAANISAVYNGTIKLWPTGTGADNKVMKFTIVSGNTWDNTAICAFNADNKKIEPIRKTATGWTYAEEVKYLEGNFTNSNFNLKTFKGFNKTVKIKDGLCLFKNNQKATSIDCSKFDTSQVSNMSFMFYSCAALASLDLSNFNTSQVNNMSFMFYYCRSLTTLDLSHFDTSKVTNMTQMFDSCKALTTLDLSHFDTSKVTTMQRIFYNCEALTALDLSNWNMTNVTNTSYMFGICSALKTVKMTNCSQETKDKIRAALDEDGLTNTVITE